MSLILYAHPFSAYCWKVLIALYENGTPFHYGVLDNPTAFAQLEVLWPLKKMPALQDGEAAIMESSVIIEYLMLHHPGPIQLIPGSSDAASRYAFTIDSLTTTS